MYTTVLQRPLYLRRKTQTIFWTQATDLLMGNADASDEPVSNVKPLGDRRARGDRPPRGMPLLMGRNPVVPAEVVAQQRNGVAEKAWCVRSVGQWPALG